jgi:hypothetical protein
LFEKVRAAMKITRSKRNILCILAAVYVIAILVAAIRFILLDSHRRSRENIVDAIAIQSQGLVFQNKDQAPESIDQLLENNMFYQQMQGMYNPGSTNWRQDIAYKPYDPELGYGEVSNTNLKYWVRFSSSKIWNERGERSIY